MSEPLGPSSTLPKLDLGNIQGDILLDGLPKRAELFYFFQIAKPADFRNALFRLVEQNLITSVLTQLRQRIRIQQVAALDPNPKILIPMSMVNIAFSAKGLEAIAAFPAEKRQPEPKGDTHFQTGMAKRSKQLADPQAGGKPAYEAPYSSDIHGVLLVTGDTPDAARSALGSVLAIINKVGGEVVKMVTEELGTARDGKWKGFEHFGFLDGVSEPAVQGVDGRKLQKEQEFVSPGKVLCGRDGDLVKLRPTWALDGSFMCFRKLHQNVPEFRKFVRTNSEQTGGSVDSNQLRYDQLAARICGRWQSGAPLPNHPQRDIVDNVSRDGLLAISTTLPDIKTSKTSKEFLIEAPIKFSHAPQGLSPLPFVDTTLCPLGAHILKMNPRHQNDFFKAKDHRIVRRGIPYGPECTTDELKTGTKQSRGLLFVCYQSDIDQGFHFLQTAWANNEKFPPNGSGAPLPGLDPFIGQTDAAPPVEVLNQGMGLKDGPEIKISSKNPFVVPRGGEYFFSPSISSLRNFLGTRTSSPSAQAPLQARL